jgi:hypothetical protein
MNESVVSVDRHKKLYISLHTSGKAGLEGLGGSIGTMSL